ncbi:MAG TPA: hypothetical protein VFY27_03070 [Woeseiaceae bacterium]|nr:hypothetical protein [Woeseiaceae bacterium]
MNRHEYRVIGMSRSGNHAIIDWILSQASGRTCFLNCAEPQSNPFSTARQLDYGCRIVANYPEFDVEAELRGDFTDKHLLLVSHEDCFLGTVARGSYEDNHDALVGPSLERRDILILRDPFNLFASRMRGEFGHVSTTTALRIWKQHAREYLGARRYLKHPRILIDYNQWASRKSYRRQIAKQLELHFTDASFEKVPATGNGSSFDGRRYNGRATCMRILERWKHFIDSEAYAALFDHEVYTLSQRIFGDIGYPGPRPERPGRKAAGSVALDATAALLPD